jgi:hypothetical protein
MKKIYSPQGFVLRIEEDDPASPKAKAEAKAEGK